MNAITNSTTNESYCICRDLYIFGRPQRQKMKKFKTHKKRLKLKINKKKEM